MAENREKKDLTHKKQVIFLLCRHALSKQRLCIFASLFLLILLSDFFLKRYVLAHIPMMHQADIHYPYGGIAIFQNFLGGIDFSINHIHNTGGAWGLFSSYPKTLLVFRIGVILGLAAHLLWGNRLTQRQWPFALIISGAVGNILDCLLYGKVIDMLCFNLWGYIFPLFNIADASICLGIGILFLQFFILDRRKEKASPKPD